MPTPAVVCLPGTLCDERVFAPALPGFLAVQRLRYQDLAGLACQQWAAALLACLPQRFALLGFSLGGLLALEIAERAPHRIAGLALVASNAKAGTPDHARHGEALLSRWDEGGADAVIDALLPRYQLPSAHEPTVRAMAREHSRALLEQQLRYAAERPARLGVWQHSAGPALLIGGARDPICPPAVQAELLQYRPDAAYWQLPDSGHFPTLDAPAACREALADWARQLT